MNQENIQEITFGSVNLRFNLSYANRKTLGITVSPDGSVLVKAPTSASLYQIHERLKKRTLWILKQQRYFESFQPRTTDKKFVGGETHLYLGRQYRLKIISDAAESVKLKGGFIVVATKLKTMVSALLKGWYLQKAKLLFHKMAISLVEKLKRYRVNPDSIVLRYMRGRWGSCTPSGKIFLNPELIKAPKGCIEYVIQHELCHLKYHDHTRKFIELQTRVMPDWEKWKNKLEKLLA